MPAYRALHHAALLMAKVPAFDCVVTGLPVSQAGDRRRVESLRAAMTGDIQVAAHKRVIVRRVEVVAQPVGAFLDTVSSL